MLQRVTGLKGKGLKIEKNNKKCFKKWQKKSYLLSKVYFPAYSPCYDKGQTLEIIGD